MENLKSWIRKPLNKQIVFTIIGTITFALVGSYAKIPTGVDLVYIYLQYAVLCFVAGKYGPVSGMICGGLGHLLIDMTQAEHIWWTWILGSVIIGFSIGYFTKKFKIKIENIDNKTRAQNRIKCALINLCSQIPVWCLLVPVLNIIFYSIEPSTAFLQGLFATFTNCLTSIVICDILMWSYDHIIFRRVVAFFVILNSLILLSYGNFGFGSILVYTAAIIFSIYVFANATVKHFTKKGVGKFAIYLLDVVVTFFLISFMFIGITSHIGSPSGNERYMIVLGAALDGDQPSKILRFRLDKAIEYANEHPDVIIITSGGQGPAEVISEGEAMRNYMISCGISEDRIVAETNSTTTIENFGYSMNIVNELEGTEDASGVEIVYVTNSYHCFRSGLDAHIAGFREAHPLASKTPTALILQSYFRETFSLLKLAFNELIGALR